MADIADQAADTEAAFLGDALVRHRLAQARTRAQSPARAADADEGACTGCGEDIPAQRRAALPDAVLCVDCQTALERQLKQRTAQ